MWVELSAEEVTRSQENIARNARSEAAMGAGFVWVALTVLGTAGIHFTRAGLFHQRQAIASPWTRFMWFGFFGGLLCLWLFRKRTRDVIAKSARRTICPNCDAAAESNAGEPCECGGHFVSLSTVKWVETP
jgi:hypothetical protein